MEMILSQLGPWAMGIGVLLVPAIGFALYKAALGVFLNPNNIDHIGDAVYQMLSKIKDNEARVLTTRKLARICCEILCDVGLKNVLKDGYSSLIDSYRE